MGRKTVGAEKKPTGRKSRSSVYSVAKIAGVSPGTVSRVLNNRSRVHEATRRRVLEAAKSAGFKPQIRARQIAILCQDDLHTLHDGTYARALTGQIAMSLCRHGMAMVIPEEPLDDMAHIFLDGAVVIGDCRAFAPTIEKLEAHTPLVFIDDFSGKPTRYTVRSDHDQAGRIAARHFLEAGRRKPAYVSVFTDADTVRMEGYRAVLREGGLDPAADLFVQRNKGTSFYSVISRVVRLGADAVYVPGSSYEALEALNVMSNVMRLEIPRQIALIGGEVPAVSEFLYPPMTTIEEPLSSLATTAIEMLVALMQGQEPPDRQVTLPVRFLGRESA